MERARVAGDSSVTPEAANLAIISNALAFLSPAERGLSRSGDVNPGLRRLALGYTLLPAYAG